jgi:uncharacterized FAD-dependent dehydrogenase
VDHLDAIVIGAGPAGLAAATALDSAGLSLKVIEFGGPLARRSRTVAEQIASGVGGAGLFSDGKFSFFPSATMLWRLQPAAVVERAYRWYADVIADEVSWAASIPAFPDVDAPRTPIVAKAGAADKRYPSFYATLDERKRVIESLAVSLEASILTETDVDDIEVTHREVRVAVRSRQSTVSFELTARALVVATGRFGPLSLSQFFPDAEWTSGRTELGVRIEQPTTEFFLRDHPSTDPKIILNSPIAARTFCCCRDGEVIASASRGIVTVSGRADGPPTGLSNVAVLIRPTEQTLADDPGLLDRVLGAGMPLVSDFAEFMHAGARTDLNAFFGSELSTQLRTAVESIYDSVGHGLPKDATVHGLAVEGVGKYPSLLRDLRWGRPPVWVVGDASGLFRGLTAAFVSGYFVGDRIYKHLVSGD